MCGYVKWSRCIETCFLCIFASFFVFELLSWYLTEKTKKETVKKNLKLWKTVQIAYMRYFSYTCLVCSFNAFYASFSLIMQQVCEFFEIFIFFLLWECNGNNYYLPALRYFLISDIRLQGICFFSMARQFSSF